jgi:hypothetical protein
MLNGTTSPAYRLHGPGEYTHLPPDLDHEERRERGLPPELHYGRKEPFRSVPISAKTPAELALVIV